MPICRHGPVVRKHLRKRHSPPQRDLHVPCSALIVVDFRGRKKHVFTAHDNFVLTSTQFFANTKAAHERCQALAPRSWRVFEQPQRFHQGGTRISKFNPIFEYLHKRAIASARQILVDQHVSHKFAQRLLGIGLLPKTQCVADGFPRWKHCMKEVDTLLKAICIANR